MSPDSYFENLLNLSTYQTDYAYNKLREGVNKTDWVTHGSPAVVDAFYSPWENSIRKLSFALLTWISACTTKTLKLRQVNNCNHSCPHRIPRRYFAGSLFLRWTPTVHELWCYWLGYWSRNYSWFWWSGQVPMNAMYSAIETSSATLRFNLLLF